MAPLACSFPLNAPLLAVSPKSAPHSNVDMPPLGYDSLLPRAIDSQPPNSSMQLDSTLSFPAHSRPAAGRKRSRDEAALENDPHMPCMPQNPSTHVEDGTEYGEGMVLIRKNQGYVADASSQSGTWLEESNPLATSVNIPQDTSMTRNYKSQRLDQTVGSSPGVDSAVDITGPSANPAATFNYDANPVVPVSESNKQPVVDDFTLHLGVGWRKISQDEHIQAAARGWSRYIENHYPLSSVAITLESRGLQAYLVESAEGFYLFAEDLRKGQLVSTRADAALQNLRQSPPAFEGDQVLLAAESPEPMSADTLNFRPEHQSGVAMELS